MWTTRLISEAAARLLALERLQESEEHEVSALKRQMIALRQGIADFDLRIKGLPAVVPTCTASFSGVVRDCLGNVVGATISFFDHATSAPLGSVTSTTGGAYSGSIQIPLPATTKTVDIVYAYNTATLTRANITLTCGSSFNLGTSTVITNASMTCGARKCGNANYSGVAFVATLGTDSYSGTTGATGTVVLTGLKKTGVYTVVGTSPNGIVMTKSVTLSACSVSTPTYNFIDQLSATCTICDNDGTSATVTFKTPAGTTIGSGTTTSGVVSYTGVSIDLTGVTVTVQYIYKGRTTTTTFVPAIALCNSSGTGTSFYNKINVHATGCSINVVGATITLGGPTAGTGTTDGSGNVAITPTIGVIFGDVISITGTKTPRWATGTGSVTVSVSGCSAINGTVTMTAASGYVCGNNAWSGGGCEPVKDTLTYTDAQGSVTLTWNGSQWAGCAMRNTAYRSQLGHPCFTFSGAGSVPVWIRFGSGFGWGVYQCTGFGSSVAVDGHTCADAFPGANFGGGGGGAVVLDSCAPFAAHYDATYHQTSAEADMWGDGVAVSFTVSE